MVFIFLFNCTNPVLRNAHKRSNIKALLPKATHKERVVKKGKAYAFYRTFRKIGMSYAPARFGEENKLYFSEISSREKSAFASSLVRALLPNVNIYDSAKKGDSDKAYEKTFKSIFEKL